jgi:hypothetical protein
MYNLFGGAINRNSKIWINHRAGFRTPYLQRSATEHSSTSHP